MNTCTDRWLRGGHYDFALKAVFFFVILLMLLPLLFMIVGLPFEWSQALGLPLVALVAAFVAMHGIRTTGPANTAVLLTISGAIGFAAEAVSLRTGTVFGSRYRYPPEMWEGGMLMDVPLAIPLFWAVFVYVGYSVVNSFLCWMGRDKPARGQPGAFLLPALVIADALVIVAIDLFMDPLLTLRGNWVWEAKGGFHGVPVGNFTGWFMVCVLVCGIFRTVEYFRGRRIGIPAAVHLMPVVAYGVLALGFVFYGFWTGMYRVTAVGAVAMGSIVALNLALYAVSGAKLSRCNPI